MAKEKTPKESHTIMTEMVLPNDTNTVGNLMGGRLLHWMDICSAITAQKHSGRVVVTASVNNVSFNQPIQLGDVVILEAMVSRAFSSSMEIFIDVFLQEQRTNTRKKCNSAIYTFVAIDQAGTPIEVPQIRPETKEDKIRYVGALQRKQLSLVLGGKMKPEEAGELRKVLFPKKVVKKS